MDIEVLCCPYTTVLFANKAMQIKICLNFEPNVIQITRICFSEIRWWTTKCVQIPLLWTSCVWKFVPCKKWFLNRVSEICVFFFLTVVPNGWETRSWRLWTSVNSLSSRCVLSSFVIVSFIYHNKCPLFRRKGRRLHRSFCYNKFPRALHTSVPTSAQVVPQEGYRSFFDIPLWHLWERWHVERQSKHTYWFINQFFQTYHMFRPQNTIIGYQ